MFPGQCVQRTFFDKNKMFCIYKNNLSEKLLSSVTNITNQEKIAKFMSDYGAQLFGNRENLNDNNEMCPDPNR